MSNIKDGLCQPVAAILRDLFVVVFVIAIVVVHKPSRAIPLATITTITMLNSFIPMMSMGRRLADLWTRELRFEVVHILSKIF